MLDAQLLPRLQRALGPLPDEGGGTLLVLAAGGTAPAMSLLSTGDVLLRGEAVMAAVWARASVAAAVEAGGGFSLLAPVAEGAIRVEVARAAARRGGALTVLEGRLTRLRLTSEPPWIPDLRFRLADGDGSAAGDFVAFWGTVREWLAAGAPDPSPPVPVT